MVEKSNNPYKDCPNTTYNTSEVELNEGNGEILMI